MMDARRVLEHHHMFALRAGRIAQLLDRGGGVVEQALAVGGIAPCAGDHARAVARTDTLLVSVDQRVERLRIDEALLDQQLLERLDPLGRLGERSIVVIMAVAMVVSVAHRLRPLRARVRERAAGNPPSNRGTRGRAGWRRVPTAPRRRTRPCRRAAVCRPGRARAYRERRTRPGRGAPRRACRARSAGAWCDARD